MTAPTISPDRTVTPAEAMDAIYRGATCVLVLGDGRRTRIDARPWAAAATPTDVELFVEPCDGPTLDVGCGPGRLAGALADRAVDATGIDISPEAVRQTRARGAAAILGDVHQLRGRRWRHVLLADGNVGIGGDPVALLARVSSLLLPRGTVLVELADAPGVRVHDNVHLWLAGRTTTPFAWATVGAAGIADVARAAGLRVAGLNRAGGREVVTLAHA